MNKKVWWVNQGSTMDEESKDGFIWAPKKDKGGFTPVHWKNMQEVEIGDIIIHYNSKQQSVRYISKVKTKAQDYRLHDDDIKFIKQWNRDGWIIYTDYHELDPSLDKKKIIQDLKDIGHIDHGPFNNVGTINQGYLFKFTDLALNTIVNNNKQINWPLFLNREIDIITNEIIEKEGELHMEENTSDSFMNYINDKGYLFDYRMIENYLLSLKVKNFIILTGNSGTGKSKLPVLFSDYLTDNNDTKQVIIDTMVKVGKSNQPQNRGWTFNRNDFFKHYPSYNKFQNTYDIEVDGIKSKGDFNFATRIFYDPKDKNIQEHLNKLSNEDPNKRINLKIFLNEINIPGSNQNNIIVPVGANWTENRHIIGFYNVIMNRYHKTPALDIILKARDDTQNPYFLILDEMNLSHVERYFSDFLSSIESNKPVPMHDEEGIESIPKNIILPDNLFVIGTVNVDETTYMFSPKVLDRANTLEFCTVSPSEYLENRMIKSFKGNVEYLEDTLSDIDLKDKNMKFFKKEFEGIKNANNMEMMSIFVRELDELHTLLQKYGFEFGFRVVNEVIKFMYVSWKYENRSDPWNNWEKYCDAQIKQKILPKIHGSQRTLGDLFEQLFRICSNGQSINIDLKNIEVKYPTSAKKIQEMNRILNEQRYVSFTR